METPDYLSQYDKQKLEECEAEAQLRLDTIARLRNEERVQALLAPYAEKDRETFLTYYADQKLFFQNFGKNLAKEEQRVSRQFERQARELFWYIQQQKLYALQLRWRAKQLELPGITLCEELENWEDNIAHCPFVEPVTAGEVALLQAWLAEPDCPEGHFGQYQPPFQKYEEICDELPEWYTYCFEQTGTEDLLDLPDLRGAEQEYYVQLYYEHERALEKAEREQRNEPEPAPYVPDERPVWYWKQAEVEEEIMKRFDKEPGLQELRRAYQASRSDDEGLDDEVIMSSDVLRHVPGPLAIEAADDWRVAIAELTAATRRKYTRLALEQVFEEYQEALARGTLAEWEKPQEKEDDYLDYLREAYTKGKELASETGKLLS